MLTLTVEDGTGKTDSNTYISRADATAYFEGRLYATSWTGATDANKDAALAMAARVLDQQVYWNGWKSKSTQAMQWPRTQCPDPDNVTPVYPTRTLGRYEDIASNLIPAWLKNAQCELALSLLVSDRTKDPDGEGLKSFELTGVLAVEFDLSTKKPVIPAQMSVELSKYGRVMGTGSAKVVRT